MALIGVHSVVIPGKKEELLILSLDVPGGKKRLCVRKLNLCFAILLPSCLYALVRFSISLGVLHFSLLGS